MKKEYAKLLVPWRAMMMTVKLWSDGKYSVICQAKSCTFYLRFTCDKKKGFKISEYQMQHTCTIEDADKLRCDTCCALNPDIFKISGHLGRHVVTEVNNDAEGEEEYTPAQIRRLRIRKLRDENTTVQKCLFFKWFHDNFEEVGESYITLKYVWEKCTNRENYRKTTVKQWLKELNGEYKSDLYKGIHGRQHIRNVYFGWREKQKQTST